MKYDTEGSMRPDAKDTTIEEQEAQLHTTKSKAVEPFGVPKDLKMS